ncbi:GAF domain-containing protein [Lichenicoccus sp.]|uniref:GAF domain-containing protein n=1 Tax=Lichenicoccus sp. TaxID=2781899 RepID=UPI003D0C6EA2
MIPVPPGSDHRAWTLSRRLRHHTARVSGSAALTVRETLPSPGPWPVSQPDLSGCDTEPVHIPGAIQPQGALLVVRPHDLLVVQASANLEGFVGMTAAAALGRTLAEVLGDAPAEALVAATERYAYAPSNVLAFDEAGGRVLQARVHRSGRMMCVELEPAVAPAALSSPIGTAQAVLASLTQAIDQAELFEIAAREIRQLTGYDRVMIYRFDPDLHGEVVAETRAPHLKGFLGLHYPATDIPLQARRMFLQQRVRLIADVHAEPVPMLVSRDLSDDAPLDMTCCTWRSVSPVHLEYLRNMGVGASCSIALSSPQLGPEADGQPGLWGLIACHHDSPYWMDAELRASVDIISQVLSMLLGSLGDADIERRRRRQGGVTASLAGRLQSDGLLVDAVAAIGADLLGLVAADGAMLRIDGEVRCLGQTPEAADAGRALSVLFEAANGALLALDDLTLRHPDLAACRRDGSGVLLQPLSPASDDAILWFRPEQQQAVVWAGNPDKLADRGIKPGPDPGRLTPRKSFEAWRQVVEGRSRRWTEADLALAAEARRAITAEALRRTQATLRRVEDRLGFALAAGSLGTWEIDPAAGRLHASAIMGAQFGLPPEARLTFEQMLGAMPSDDRAAYLLKLARTLADDSSFNAQFRARRPDGSERWIEHRGRLLRQSGRPATLTGIALDITGRKQIEAESHATATGWRRWSATARRRWRQRSAACRPRCRSTRAPGGRCGSRRRWRRSAS